MLTIASLSLSEDVLTIASDFKFHHLQFEYKKEWM